MKAGLALYTLLLPPSTQMARISLEMMLFNYLYNSVRLAARYVIFIPRAFTGTIITETFHQNHTLWQ